LRGPTGSITLSPARIRAGLFKPAQNCPTVSIRFQLHFLLKYLPQKIMQPNPDPSCRTGCKGKIPGKEEEMFPGTGNNVQTLAIMFPIAIIFVVFAFVSVLHWIDSQRKERDAFYKAETIRRVTEASGDGAKAALELMKTDERLKRLKAREGLKIGGLINIGVGVGVMIFLHALLPGTAIYLSGSIPALIGVGFITYVYVLAAPIE
jgi:hypothetical protein